MMWSGEGRGDVEWGVDHDVEWGEHDVEWGGGA